MKYVFTKTTYLEMLSPPVPDPSERTDPPGMTVRHLDKPPLEDYRRLHSGVGSAYNWIDRQRMSDEELLGIIHDDWVDIRLLCMEGEPAGFAELDRRQAGQVQLMYFGLLPSFIGQGLGKAFLAWTVRHAWSYRPERVWVHTCDLDHKAALPNYLKAGFVAYDERVIKQAKPD